MVVHDTSPKPFFFPPLVCQIANIVQPYSSRRPVRLAVPSPFSTWELSWLKNQCQSVRVHSCFAVSDCKNQQITIYVMCKSQYSTRRLEQFAWYLHLWLWQKLNVIASMCHSKFQMPSSTPSHTQATTNLESTASRREPCEENILGFRLGGTSLKAASLLSALRAQVPEA